MREELDRVETFDRIASMVQPMGEGGDQQVIIKNINRRCHRFWTLGSS